jgi:hypothetical protein
MANVANMTVWVECFFSGSGLQKPNRRRAVSIITHQKCAVLGTTHMFDDGVHPVAQGDV